MSEKNNINIPMVVEPETAYRCPNIDCRRYFSATSPRCPYCGQKVETAEERKRNLRERAEMVRAMETVCRNLNDEDILMSWLMCGVADGDITSNTTDEEIQEEYCTDGENFADLMDCFLRCMKRAYESGGLYCGDIVSNIGEENE